MIFISCRGIWWTIVMQAGTLSRCNVLGKYNVWVLKCLPVIPTELFWIFYYHRRTRFHKSTLARASREASASAAMALCSCWGRRTSFLYIKQNITLLTWCNLGSLATETCSKSCLCSGYFVQQYQVNLTETVHKIKGLVPRQSQCNKMLKLESKCTYTSTRSTLTPQGSVASSREVCSKVKTSTYMQIKPLQHYHVS